MTTILTTANVILCETCYVLSVDKVVRNPVGYVVVVDNLDNLMEKQIEAHYYCTEHAIEAVARIDRYHHDELLAFYVYDGVEYEP